MSIRLIILFLFALAIRLLYVGVVNPPTLDLPADEIQGLYNYLDGDGYLTLTQAFHDGEFLTSPEHQRRMPLYPALLAFFSKFLTFGALNSFWQVKLIQVWHALLDMITLACVHLAVRKLSGETPALCAGLLYALYPLAIYRLPMMNTEIIQATALAVFVLGTLHFLYQPTIYSALGISLITGAILYITPAFQFFPLFFAIALFFLYPARNAFPLVAAYLIPVILIVGLWGARNYMVSGQFYLFDVRGGKEFWLGNNVESNGEWEGPYRAVWEKEYFDEANRIEAEGGTKHDENRYFHDKGIQEILENPLGVAVLWYKKFWRFWFIPASKEKLWATIPIQAFYLSLGLLGLYAAGVRNRANLFVLCVILYFCFIYTASYACIRFSHPVMPWVCAFGGVGAMFLFDKMRGQRLNE